MTDRSTGYTLATIFGVLSKLVPIAGGVILVIDGNTENGIIVSFEHYSAGWVEHGNIRARFGLVELELSKISAPAEAA